MRVAGGGEHADVGAGAEDLLFSRTEDDHLDRRMLETKPLDRIMEFYIDAEVVGIELQLITVEQAALFIDVHDQGRHLAIDLDRPMLVTGRTGLKIDDHMRLAPGSSRPMIAPVIRNYNT